MDFKSRPYSNVTLLHKRQGPSLFQYETKPFPVSEKADGSPLTPKSDRRPLLGPLTPPKKRVVAKCMERQEENSMFTKRMQARAARHYYQPPGGTSASSKTVKSGAAEQQQCELYLRERLFTNSPHKPSSFPPPTFMPLWNPRHKNRTYLSKMTIEDPWSLPPEKREELKKKTGLRLKSISKHYQFKVGANLPFGKAADSGCNCHVDFCNHCKKSHQYRCPLHIQLLEDFDPDCKTVLGETCPFSRQVEDLPLDRIQDVSLYMSEVVRRLKAGEIQEAPPFPPRFFSQERNSSGKNQKYIPASADASTDALDSILNKKAVTDDSCTQTEPFIIDVDDKAAFKENICQTKKPEKDEPLMRTSILKALGSQTHYVPHPVLLEKTTQVTPCKIQSFFERSQTVVKSLTKQIMQQAMQEISNETRLQLLQKYRAKYTQECVDLGRTASFKFLQEKWRHNAYVEELSQIENETVEEAEGELAISAVGFAISYFFNFPGKVMSSLRREGFIVNKSFDVIDTELRNELNQLTEEKLDLKDKSVALLDGMIQHALFDIEMDAFIGHMVDGQYLEPLNWTQKFLRDVMDLEESNLEMLRKLKDRLLTEGWYFNDKGHLVHQDIDNLGSRSSSDVSFDAFMKGLRVSVDADGTPKYLVDVTGKSLPINIRWTEILEEQVEQNRIAGRKTWRFDLVLDEKSLSDTQIEETPFISDIGFDKRVSKKARTRSEKSTAGLYTTYTHDKDGFRHSMEGEEHDDENHDMHEHGVGLDWDYLHNHHDIADDNDDEDHGRLVFKTKEYKDDGDEDHEHLF